jgi:hypothetical protein
MVVNLHVECLFMFIQSLQKLDVNLKTLVQILLARLSLGFSRFKTGIRHGEIDR